MRHKLSVVLAPVTKERAKTAKQSTLLELTVKHVRLIFY